MKGYISAILIFLIYSASIAQTVKVGFRIEPSVLLTEQKNNSSNIFAPFSLYFTTIVEPVDKLSFEIRPGFLLGGEYYGGFEIGAYMKWMLFNSKYFLTSGLLNHSNTMIGAHNGGSGFNKNFLFYGIGVGYSVDSRLNIDLMYYQTEDKDFARIHYFNSAGTITDETIQMNGIIKISFCFTWDVL